MQLDFIVIFGTRWHFRRRRGGWEGTLNCPDCQRPEIFVEKDAFRAFTLYWIPLFKTETAGSLVECRGCGGRFDPPEELGGPPSPRADLSVFLR